MARSITPEGVVSFIPTPSGLAALQAAVGGYIEWVTLPDGGAIICDEEGKLKGRPINRVATTLWHEADPRARGADVLCGTVLVLTPEDAQSAE